MATEPPATLEICQRTFNAGRCHGVIYRPQPEIIVCGRCGGHEPGAVYALACRYLVFVGDGIVASFEYADVAAEWTERHYRGRARISDITHPGERK